MKQKPMVKERKAGTGSGQQAVLVFGAALAITTIAYTILKGIGADVQTVTAVCGVAFLGTLWIAGAAL